MPLIKNTNSSLTLKNKGFSLIELLISISLGILLSGAILAIVISSSKTNQAILDSSNLSENGRYVSSLLQNEIQMSGYFSYLDSINNIVTTDPLLPNPCSVNAATFIDGISLPVQGYNNVAISGGDAASLISACLASGENVAAGTDVLVTRRAESSISTGTLSSTTYYFQTTPDTFILNTGASAFSLTKKDGLTIEDIREYKQYIFYVSAATSTEPATLKRLELNGGSFTRISLAEGVEDFQIEYGIDRSGNGAPNESAAGAGDNFVQKPASISEWQNVVTIKTYLLMQSEQEYAAYTNNKTYLLGLKGGYGPMNDGYKRRLFVNSNRITNVGIKREAP